MPRRPADTLLGVPAVLTAAPYTALPPALATRLAAQAPGTHPPEAELVEQRVAANDADLAAQLLIANEDEVSIVDGHLLAIRSLPKHCRAYREYTRTGGHMDGTRAGGLPCGSRGGGSINQASPASLAATQQPCNGSSSADAHHAAPHLAWQRSACCCRRLRWPRCCAGCLRRAGLRCAAGACEPPRLPPPPCCWAAGSGTT